MKTRYSLICLLASSVLAFTACSGMLDIPQHSVADVQTYYQTDGEAEEGIIACYDQVRALEVSTNGLQFVKTHLSDDVWSGGGSHYDGTFYMLSDYTFSSDFGAIATMYENLYKLVYRANVVLEKVTGNSAVMKRAVAEA